MREYSLNKLSRSAYGKGLAGSSFLDASFFYAP
uniref:Uncharacterized protein n=1 Tax=Rhizophora mucronata TaxID=61149 RepID=A0A2P2JHB3_RHIMU